MKSTFERIRKQIDSALTLYNDAKKDFEQHSQQLSKIEIELQDHKRVREIFQQASVFTQAYLEKHLSSIVTNAVQSVFFEKDLEFRVEFDKKRNSTECNLYLVEGDEEYDLLDDRGFGMADVISFALRVAYVLLDKVDPVMILDEPFRNLDAIRIPYASEMVQSLSKKLGIQFIIVSHIDNLADHADKVYHVSKRNDCSQMRLEESQ